ncbi:MAG: ATP-binding protein [Pseudomonadota bacterium]
MSRSFLNDITNYSQGFKPIGLKSVINVAFSYNLDSLSGLEANLIRKYQLDGNLKFNALLSICSMITANIIWLTTKYKFQSNGLDQLILIQNAGSAWAVANCAYFYFTTKNTNPSKIQFYTYIALNLPNIAAAAIFWGYAPIFIELTFGAGNNLGMPLFISILVMSIFWGLPFFQLGLFLSLSIFSTFSYHYSAHLGNDSSLLIPGASILYLAFIAFNFLLCALFVFWVRRQVVMEHQLNMSNLFLSELDTNSSVCLWRCDENGKLMFLSEHVRHALNIKADEMHRHDITFLFNEGSAKTPQLISALNSRKSFNNIHLTHTHNDKKSIWSVSGKPIYDQQKEFFGYNGIGTNITKEHEIKKLEQQKTFYDSFTEISSTLSHDFNNLLAGITLRLEHIKNDLPQESRNTFIDQSLDLCNKAANITSKMLAYSKKESLNMTHFNLDIALKLTIDQNNLHTEKPIHFELSGTEGIYIYSDESLLHSALINIINNAIRATQEDSTIYIKRRIVNITKILKNTQYQSLKFGSYVYISIEDSGPGFLTADLEKGFNPFYTRNRESGGSGLGLSMVKGFAMQTGGEAYISNGKKGAKVELFLPDIRLPASQKSQTNAPSNDTTKSNILLIEDNISFGDLLHQQLLDRGYDVQFVHNVADAKQRLNSDPLINLIITDFLLPDGKGSDIVRYARTLNTEMNAMYISGYLDDEIKNPAEKATVLRKPFTINEFINRINDVVGNPQTGNT